MRPFGRRSYAPARREPGSRQPEQYALENGLIQIPGHRKPGPFLLQSKVGRHGSPTTTYRMWKRLSERPGGTRLFSAAAMVRVPYFASIAPHVVRMEPGFVEVTVPKWFFVKVA
jgi:hypothetical protein